VCNTANNYYKQGDLLRGQSRRWAANEQARPPAGSNLVQRTTDRRLGWRRDRERRRRKGYCPATPAMEASWRSPMQKLESNEYGPYDAKKGVHQSAAGDYDSCFGYSFHPHGSLTMSLLPDRAHRVHASPRPGSLAGAALACCSARMPSPWSS
jgi:hypothetical protein